MGKPEITIKDIAQRLKISVSTVSRALSNHPRIGLRTKEQVLALAKELNYRPNTMAVNLKKNKSRNIGVIIPDLSKPFYAKLITGVDEIASREGYNLIICQSNENTEREEKLLQVLINSRVEGIIVCIANTTVDPSRFLNVLKLGIPVIFCDRGMSDLNIPSIVTNDFQGAYDAVEYLIKKGCTHIVHLAGSASIPNSISRRDGYLHALSNYQLPFQKVMYTNFDTQLTQIFARQLMNARPRPDAIFCYNDYVAYDAIEVVKTYDLKIGKDILMVGFADEPIAQYMSPKLTTVFQPVAEMGGKAMEMLLELLSEAGNIKEPIRMLPTKLVIRESA